MKKYLHDLKDSIYDMKIWQVILIIVSLTIVPSCAGYHAYVTSINRLANEQKNQEELRVRQITDDITVKYKSALQAKNQKDWNKVITILSAIDLETVEKNENDFRAKHEINSDKELKEAINEKKGMETWFIIAKEEKIIAEDKYNKLLESKPVTKTQINILKHFAEGMIEYEAGNYKKADNIFRGIQNISESDFIDEYYEIIKKTRQLLTVEVPVKIVDATCVMKKDEPYFTITIENPLDEPVHVSQLVEKAIEKNGEFAHYTYPPEYVYHLNIDVNIPAKSKIIYKYHGSVFLHNIKYYLLSIDNFYMKSNDKSYRDLEKYAEGKIFKIEVKD